MLRTIIAENAIGLVVVNAMLTPVQQRNLERRWQAKVIDRTGLILEIFGARARTQKAGYKSNRRIVLPALKARPVVDDLNVSVAVSGSSADRVRASLKSTAA